MVETLLKFILCLLNSYFTLTAMRIRAHVSMYTHTFKHGVALKKSKQLWGTLGICLF